MLRSTALCLILMMSPAMAAEMTKDDATKLASTYMAAFNKQDSAGIASHFTKDGVHVNPTGIRKPAEYYDELFKAGMTKLDVTVDEVKNVKADIALAVGEFTVTGKDKEGKDLKVQGRWADTLVNEGGAWKIRMLVGFPVPPPKTEAAAK